MNQEEVFQTLKNIIMTCDGKNCMNCKIHWFCVGWNCDDWEEAYFIEATSEKAKSVILTPPED